MAHAQKVQDALTWGFDTEVETLHPDATAKCKVQLVIRNILPQITLP